MSEQEQWEIYEFLRPELKGKKWKYSQGKCRGWCAEWIVFVGTVDSYRHYVELPPLYGRDGSENMNTVWEAKRRLEEEGVWVIYNTAFEKPWQFLSESRYAIVRNPAFWPALVEYLESAPICGGLGMPPEVK